VNKSIRDFTHGELAWKPWVPPLDITAATPEQLAALKITPSNRAVGAYSLVLAHDPEALNERSPLYNGIMFGAKGLPRAERELGAVTASRINGCAYCASVHALRFNQLAKQPEVMERIQRDGVEAKLEPRLQAVLDYAAKLTRDPAAITGADAKALREQGLSDLEILDLTHAVAMFAWANRLMQTLGEAADPAAPGDPL
jgi:uncharacterized peroxidase-related enzyme